MSVQPILYIPVPQPLPPPGNTPNQPGVGQPPPQLYPSLQPGPSGPYFQPPIVTEPAPIAAVPFAIGVKKARALMGFGIIQVILGVASIVFNGVGYHVHTATTWVGPGFWAGVPFIVSGAFGIAAGLKKTKAMVITTLVLSTSSAVLAALQFSFAVISLVHNEDLHYRYMYNYYPYDSYYYRWGENYFIGAMAMDGFLVTFAILQAGVAIPSSALACNSLCCQQATNTITPVNQQFTSAAQHPPVTYAGAYYNPQMAYPVQFQPQPVFISHPQMPAEANGSQAVGPPDIQVSTDTPTAPPGQLKEPN